MLYGNAGADKLVVGDDDVARTGGDEVDAKEHEEAEEKAETGAEAAVDKL